MSVLYFDHSGHPSPLALSYHATASRHLTSGDPNVYPPSIAVEVDAAYCPQCLAYYEPYTATNPPLRGRCGRPQCKLCPICESPLGFRCEAGGKNDSSTLVCLYKCGYCGWNSRQCGLVVNAQSSEKESVIAAAEDMGKLYEDKIIKQTSLDGENTADSSASAVFATLCQGIQKRAQTERLHQQLGNNRLSAAAASALRIRVDPSSTINSLIKKSSPFSSLPSSEAWSIDALEDKIKRRQQEAKEALTFCILSQSTRQLLTNEETRRLREIDDKYGIVSPWQSAAQGTIHPYPPDVSSSSECSISLLPMGIPLRARKSKRCIAELALGKPGILVKTKMNPLEGDTSLRSGHGQWWKKDCSAVHVIPKISVVRYKTRSTQGVGTVESVAEWTVAMLLKVQNPTLGVIRLRLATPSKDIAANKDKSFMRHIRLDAYNPHYADVLMMKIKEKEKGVDKDFGSNTSEWVELDAKQDSLLEVTRKPKASADNSALGAEPSPVDRIRLWNGAHLIESYVASKSEMCSFTVITRDYDAAWVEVVMNCSHEARPGIGKGLPHYFGVPMSLQIEVGNGSWETSLVSSKPQTGNIDVDSVCIDLVVVIEKMNDGQMLRSPG